MRPPWPFQPLSSPARPSFNWSVVNGEVPWANVILGINIGGIGAKTSIDQKLISTVDINWYRQLSDPEYQDFKDKENFDTSLSISG